MSKIFLIGLENTNLTASSQAVLGRCGVVFAARRFHASLVDFSGTVLPITPLHDALQQMHTHLDRGDIAVLASGDPLFFGIGQSLLDTFGSERVEIFPALSSMQRAFAKIKMPWQDAFFCSLHGRNRKELLTDILRHPKVFLFTDPRNTPSAIAEDLLQLLHSQELTEADLALQASVAENIGEAEEKITSGTLAAIAGGRFADLNVMIITHTANSRPEQRFSFGLTAEDIQHSRGLITKDEVRAAVLHKLQLPPQGVFWDIGAGSGSISVEAGRLQPGLQIYAVEKNRAEQKNIFENRKRYRLWQMQLIGASAPEALETLPAPDRVFIGGSGGSLEQIITATALRLAADGIIVATAVTESTRSEAPKFLRQHGFSVEVTTLQVERVRLTEHGQEQSSFNPITIITGRRRQSENH